MGVATTRSVQVIVKPLGRAAHRFQVRVRVDLHRDVHIGVAGIRRTAVLDLSWRWIASGLRAGLTYLRWVWRSTRTRWCEILTAAVLDPVTYDHYDRDFVTGDREGWRPERYLFTW
jgi:hypothetical protein